MKNVISDCGLNNEKIKTYPVIPLKKENDIVKLLDMIQGDFKIAIGSRKKDNTIDWETILDIPREYLNVLSIKYKFAEDNRIEMVSEISPIVVSIDNMYLAEFEENVINFPSYFGRKDFQGDYVNYIPEPFEFKEQNLNTLGILCRDITEGIEEYDYILSVYAEKYLKEYVERYGLIGKVIYHGNPKDPKKTEIKDWMDLKEFGYEGFQELEYCD